MRQSSAIEIQDSEADGGALRCRYIAKKERDRALCPIPAVVRLIVGKGVNRT
jgi:hypothetical protein